VNDNRLKAFEVDITQSYAVFTYDLNAAFFELFENSLLEEGKLTATVKVYNQYSPIRLLFNIIGTVALVCDRSLAAFEYPVCIKKEVNFKLGWEDRELAEESYMIKRDSTIINVAQHLYDFVSLAIPMKKLHPRFFMENKDLPST